MLAILGNCGCCTAPPVDPPPGDNPDPHWSARRYFSAKYAEASRIGVPSLKNFFAAQLGASGQPYDSGKRYASMSWLSENLTRAESFREQWEVFKWVDFNAAIVSSNSFIMGVSNWPNVIDYIRVRSAGMTGQFGAAATNVATATDAAVNYTSLFFGEQLAVTATATDEIPESALDIVDEKLDAVQFLQNTGSFGAQVNPTGPWTISPYSEGARSGWHTVVPDVPERGTFTVGNGAPFLVSSPAAYDVATKARGDVSTHRGASTGLKVFRRKQKTQLGYKRIDLVNPESISYDVRRYSIPDGYDLIAGRVGGYQLTAVTGGLTRADLRLPANVEHTGNEILTLHDGDMETFDPAPQEVIIFSSASADDLMRPPAPELYGQKKTTGPVTVGVIVWHEEACMAYELWRANNINMTGAVLVATVDAEPYNYPELIAGPWSGFSRAGNTSPNANIMFQGGGFFQKLVDTTAGAGQTYCYAVKGYYGSNPKSGYTPVLIVVT